NLIRIAELLDLLFKDTLIFIRNLSIYEILIFILLHDHRSVNNRVRSTTFPCTNPHKAAIPHLFSFK
ncbi:MAG TPA: hypothetical protein VGE24_15395, partial [Emticicia sp.]